MTFTLEEPGTFWLISALILAVIWIPVIFYIRHRKETLISEALELLESAFASPQTAPGAITRSITPRRSQGIGLSIQVNDHKIDSVRLWRPDPDYGTNSTQEPIVLGIKRIKIKLKPGSYTFRRAERLFAQAFAHKRRLEAV